MTRDEIAGRVYRNLEDEDALHFTSDDINDAIQDGYDELALETLCVEKIANVNWVANQVYYNFSSLISDFYNVFAIWNKRNNKWIGGVTWRELRESTFKWSTMLGETFLWAPFGYSHIGIYRTPTVDDSTNPMVVMYSAQAETLIGSDTPSFPPDLHDTLVEYATGDLLNQDLEYTKSLIYINRYEEKKQRIKDWMNKRSTPDRIYSLMARYNMINTRI